MFLNNLRAGPPAGDDFWYTRLETGAPTLSGAHVSTDTAMRLSTVFKCIKVIAETIGMVPLHLYRSEGDRRRRVTDHPLHRLLATRPNAWQTPMQFRTMMEAHRSLRGNGYARIYSDASGEPTDIIPIHPDRVTPELTADGTPRYRITNAQGLWEATLLPGEILHLCGLSLDGYVGLNPIAFQREAVGSAIAARDYGSRFWNNDARPPFWVKFPGQLKDAEARSNIRTEWQEMYGGSNRGKPAILDRGMEIHELGLSNEDSQWIDARKYSDVDICGLFRIPPHKIGILDRATWGNIEHQNIEFVTDCILPLTVSWEQTIARDAIVDEALFVEHVLEILLRGDTTTRFNAYGKAIQDGWMTRNEARRLENREPLPGLDEPLQPLNMTTAGASALAQPARPPARPTVPSPGRAATLLAANAARVARKEAGLIAAAVKAARPLAEAFADHAGFVATVMAVSAEAAAAYTAATIARAESLLAADPAFTTQQWVDTQTAALLQLES